MPYLCMTQKKGRIMATKHIERVVAPATPHYVGNGFRVHNFIPGAHGFSMHRMDPFIVMDYNSKFRFTPSATPRGVGVHPHRGFETVTIAYKGRIAHHDSSGSSGVIDEGDVQWMTAGAGILHKEYHEQEFSRTGGDFQMVQLWVNLPAKDKNAPPKYQSLVDKEIARHALDGDSGYVKVIAGRYGDVAGSASTFSPVNLYDMHLNRGGKATFSFPAHYTTALLVVEGSIRVNGDTEVATDHFAVFGRQGEAVSIEADESAVVLVLGGEPLNEPIAAQGPFVMNTREELVQAYEDFNLGRFGYLED